MKTHPLHPRRLSLLFCLLLLGAAIPARADPPPAEAAYQKARRAFYRFKADKSRQKFRHNWQRVAARFEKVASQFPDSSRAPDALYTAGRLYLGLYEISRVPADLERALELFGQVVERFPQNHLADDSQLYVATAWLEYLKQPQRARNELAFLVNAFPQGDVTPKARSMLEDLGGSSDSDPEVKTGKQPSPASPTAGGQKTAPARTATANANAVAEKQKAAATRKQQEPVLEAVKHWSNPDYTRIALYTRSQVRFRVGRLEAEPGGHKPHRLYVDLLGTELGDEVPATMKVRDSLVSRIRVAERDGGFIRVVLDCRQPFSQKVIPLQNPDRVVVDLSKDNPRRASPRPSRPRARPRSAAKKKIAMIKRKSRPEVSLSVMAGLKIKRIVIDPGHGGRDPGAIGPTGALEKKLVLDIARRLARLVREKLELEVLLTRTNDKFIPLEGRTAFANEHRADLFVSIHLNAHTNRRFHGVETFYLDLTDDRYSIRLAARENATSEKTISDLKYILADLATKSNTDDSIQLSRLVQRSLVRNLRARYRGIKSLGIKPALFYVLIGARMPAILVEASFITNRREEKRLRTAAYRQKIAEGLCQGIADFIKARQKIYAGGAGK